ncbi:hypothetical protein [Streptomyces aidingensis]|uniref:Uncharacterized protein n=1 Tax=Streptomyces aidingensis TaxID=910347 RepID=A0A1I1PT39_9ACTN|nr:hypothetical protein [Streptomyces aidingensis]SFD13026.1 hypothetical protein SAMN05421773_11035 [Streptomyces aidingensis]
MTTFADEMPEPWVRALADHIEAGGWGLADAHESAIAVHLGDTARGALGAADTDRYLVIGWSAAGADWGLAASRGHVPHPQLLPGDTPVQLAAAVGRLMRTGRAEPREIRHAVPYGAPGEACTCERITACRGLIPDADCPEHGDRRNPAMTWHWEALCPPGA